MTMEPFVKRQDQSVFKNGWSVTDGYGDVVAVLNSELLADVIMDRWVNGGHDEPGDDLRRQPPEFKEGQPYSHEPSKAHG